MAPETPGSPAEHWEEAYRSKTSDRHSWYQADPAISLSMIHNAGLGPGEAVIDVGGGASRLAVRLLEEGFTDLTVLDISSVALAASRDQLGAAAERVEWVCTDIRAFRPARRYALWHDRALFHFLTDPADQAAYLAALKAGLRKDGHLVLAAFAVGGPKRCSGLDIVQYDASRLSAVLGPEFILAEQAQEAHVTPTGGEQLFAWFRYRRN